MKLIKITMASAGLILLAGCVTQSEVQLSDNFWKSKQKIAIAEVKSPKP